SPPKPSWSRNRNSSTSTTITSSTTASTPPPPPPPSVSTMVTCSLESLSSAMNLLPEFHFRWRNERLLRQAVPIKPQTEQCRRPIAVEARQREQTVNRTVWIMAMAVACAACNKGQPDDAAQPTPVVEENMPAPAPADPETIKPGEPGGLPDDRTPLEE